MSLWSRRSKRHSHAICTTARWETPYVSEWLAYHQAIGFDHVYLYCNDDDPGELYTEVSAWLTGDKPFVTFVHCPHQGQQWWMHVHYLTTHKDEAEWVLFLDIDEFLSLRRDRTIGDFMARRRDTDCVYFWWTMFGHSGFAERPPGSVLRQYTRRQVGLTGWTKAITRTSAIDPARLKPEFRGFVTHPHHGWDHELGKPGLRSQDVLGADMRGYWPDQAAGFHRLFGGADGAERVERVFGEAVLHHYAIRSEADFRRRVQRGLGGDFGAQAQWGEREAAGTAGEVLAQLNAVEDRTLADWWTGWLRRQTAGLDMYGPEPVAPLLSRGRACLQSSAWIPDGMPPVDLATAAAAGVDGRAITGAFAFHTAVEDAPWFQVDLGGACLIHEVRLYNRMDMQEVVDRSRRIGFSVSDDGERWRRVFERRDPSPFGGADGHPLRWRPPAPIKGRWLRVELLERGILHLEQVEVYGRPA